MDLCEQEFLRCYGLLCSLLHFQLVREVSYRREAPRDQELRLISFHLPLCGFSGRGKSVAAHTPRSSIIVCHRLGWVSTLDEVQKLRLLASDGVRIRVVVSHDVAQDSVKLVLCRMLALVLVHT
jgi:hypothetical protein